MRCSLSQSETLRPLLQKSPLAFPLHKFHQSDQSERIAFRASFFHSHSRVRTHTHVTQTHCSALHKSVFTCLFECTSHVSKRSTNLLEIIDFYRFDCSSILHEQTEIEKAAMVSKGKARVLLLYRTKTLCISHVRHVSQSASTSFNFSDMICT